MINDPDFSTASASSLWPSLRRPGSTTSLVNWPRMSSIALDLHGRLAAAGRAAAAGELVGVFLGQGHRRAISDLDGREPPEQWDRDWVGHDHLLQDVSQSLLEEADELVGEAFLDRFGRHVHADLGGGGDEVVGRPRLDFMKVRTSILNRVVPENLRQRWMTPLWRPRESS